MSTLQSQSRLQTSGCDIESLEAHDRQCEFTVGPVDTGLALEVQNAFKFTQHRTEVSLNAYAAADRIRIDVEDHCGGLPPGVAEDLFLPFKQSGEDRSGLGR